MIPQVPQQLRMLDAVSAAGLGLALALFYDVLRFFIPRGKIRLFICDFLTFGIAGMLLISFAVSHSYTGVFRWYMALGAGAGYAAYLWGIAPLTARLFSGIRFVLKLPGRLVFRYILKPLGISLHKCTDKIKKRCAIKRKSKRKHLRKEQKVLYNSN